MADAELAIKARFEHWKNQDDLSFMKTNNESQRVNTKQDYGKVEHELVHMAGQLRQSNS